MTDDKELKDQRVPIMMSPSELVAIDDWMFRMRLRSRGEAIRRLCQVSLFFFNDFRKIFSDRLTLSKKLEADIETIREAVTSGSVNVAEAATAAANILSREADELEIFLKAAAPAMSLMTPDERDGFTKMAQSVRNSHDAARRAFAVFLEENVHRWEGGGKPER